MYAKDEYLKVEQDSQGPGDDLPTYDDLAAQSGPNSRFGRWRGWIEKRAAERYRDITPDELTRRRARGWGEDVDPNEIQDPQTTTPAILNQPPAESPTYLPLHLRIHTDLPPIPPAPNPHTPTPFLGQRLSPTRLRLNQFGSRFLPHASTTIHCLLPLLSDRLLLIGHDEGLSVLDTYPQESNEAGSKGPDEAQARVLWEGDAVFQMSILEIESTGNGTPQGVVLALVGPEAESSKDQESLRTLRMYNLASLISLAQWVVKQKARPVDLRRPSQWDAQQSPTKKHLSHSSIAKGLRSLITESPVSQSEPHSLSYQSLMPSNVQPGRNTPLRKNSTNSPDATWDVVEDLPLRWSTDYVSLATPGSRLINCSASSYALWREGRLDGRGGALLAVATKFNILLYEKPKGERSFRFVKEFYTPVQPRNISFIQQSVQNTKSSVSDLGNSSKYQQVSTDTLQNTRSTTAVKPCVGYSTQLCIFVIFDKKAGVIRIADSAVGEVELPNDPAFNIDGLQMRESLASISSRRSRMLDTVVPSKGPWVLPERLELPPVITDNQLSSFRAVYFLSRGKQTQIFPAPLPANLSNTQPFFTLTWESQPSHVSPRICHSAETGVPPFLQLVALGEDGVEVQEISLSVLNKGKGRAEEPVRTSADILGDAGFLCVGGHWHRPGYPHQMTRPYSTVSAVSGTSFDSLETEEIIAKMEMEQGIYGWCRKGLEDWRVFWVGGTGGVGQTGNSEL